MENLEYPRPKVGLGLVILRDNKILLGKRKGSHGAGEYGGPGGHLEGMESFEECITREMSEEIGDNLAIKNLGFLCVTNLTKYKPNHFVDIGMVAEWVSGEPQIMEPNKIESWGWYDLENLPTPLFGCVQNYIDSLKTKQPYYQSE